jgi:hypothetical protein
MVRTYSAARELARYINEKHNPKDSTAIIYYGMLIPERMPIQDICDRLIIPTFDEITEFPYLARKNKILVKFNIMHIWIDIFPGTMRCFVYLELSESL